MKYTLTIFLITVVMNMAHSQTPEEFWAEDFLAEVFFGNMNTESPKIYTNKTSFVPMFTSIFDKSNLYTQFCKRFNLCDSAVVNEMYEYYVQHFDDNKPIT